MSRTTSRQADFLPCKNVADDLSVGGGVAPGEGFDWRALEAEVFGSDFVGVDTAVANFGDASGAGDGDFVEAVGAVDDQGAAQS